MIKFFKKTIDIFGAFDIINLAFESDGLTEASARFYYTGWFIQLIKKER